jgi:hypothetical protein
MAVMTIICMGHLLISCVAQVAWEDLRVADIGEPPTLKGNK